MKNVMKFGMLGLVVMMMSSCGNTNNTNEEETNAIVEPKKEVLKDYNYYIDRIGNDEEWMGSINEQAKELGITAAEALHKNAAHMAKKNGFEAKPTKDVAHYIERIKNDKEWFDVVKKEALIRGISVDSMLIISANYTIKNSSQ